jgi:RNA polymerase sigma-70 factor (ECF subfamily)
MGESDWLAKEFEANRKRLQVAACRMLGSVAEAEDVVQEAWLRLSRSDAGEVENLGGWLTTVVARGALDRLRARKSRREEPLETQAIGAPPAETGNPEHDVLLADSVGPALLVVLDTLTPRERVAFVLHDMFGLSFEEIAPIVDRTPAAARKLASRARGRVQGRAKTPDASLTRRREIVDAFLAASREGDFGALLALLDPAVVLRADAAAVTVSAARQAQGAPRLAPELHGPHAVAETFSGRARTAQPALIDGAPGAVWAPGGEVRAVFMFAVERGSVTGIEVVAETARIAALDIR